MDASALKEAKGWIDPCPLWDEDGKAYMVFAYAKSRCGIKHKLSVCEISLDAENPFRARLVYDGTQTNPTLEGPNFISGMAGIISLRLPEAWRRDGRPCCAPGRLRTV